MGADARNYTPYTIRRQVEQQRHLCAYCLLPFGTVTRHRGHDITQKPQGDHFEPFVLGRKTQIVNLVASCQICNQAKGSQVFEDIEACRKAVLVIRSGRGYRVLFVPNYPITENPWRWASEYAAWLID
jgi:hypothetical protein